MKIVYCAQFRDLSGYGIAARGYLKSLHHYLQNTPNNIELKLYSTIVNEDKILSSEIIDIIEKYEFKSDQELEEWARDEYLFIWHMPPAMVAFSDDKFKPSPGCSPNIKRLLKYSTANINLSVWETSHLPREYSRTYEYFQPDAVITSSKWNQEVFGEYIDSHVVPHLIEEPDRNLEEIKLPFDLQNSFVLLCVSQWSIRKGFDKLLQAYISEFGSQKDVLLLIKTYPGPETGGVAEPIKKEIKFYRDIIRIKDKANNIALLPSFLSTAQLNWLYDKSDAFVMLTRGEGFSLPIAESIMRKKPVIVPEEGGHVDYIHPDAAFFVDGRWDTCISIMPPYDIDGEWFDCSVKSARLKMREAYNCWKDGTLKKKGQIGKKHIVSSSYDLASVGKLFIETSKKVLESKKSRTKVANLKREMTFQKELQGKLDVLHNSYEGETCYILSCGPSLNEMSAAALKDKLKDKLVFSVKQAYEKFSDITDFHFFNCANLPSLKGDGFYQEHYQYKDQETIVITSSNYTSGSRWSPYQKSDVFFKVPIRTEINNEFIVKTKEFDEYLLKDHPERPCGPGIMYETVIYMALHLGVKKIVVLGWDLSYNDPKSLKEYKHFYGETGDLINRGDILSWEITETREASEDMYKWLQNMGVELELASKQSTLYEGIPRVSL